MSAPVDPGDFEKCLDVMERLVGDSARLTEFSEEQRIRLMSLAGKLSRPNRDELRLRNRAIRKEVKRKIQVSDRGARATTGIRAARLGAFYLPPARIEGETVQGARLNSRRNCYVCKAEFDSVHHFYDSMCTKCGDFNYSKRFQTAPLHGQVALITGARMKIGYQAALMMLRAGARVIVTTRFPRDAAKRYSGEKDFSDFKDRLEIHGLDLRHAPSVEIFCQYLENTEKRLDILINNAAQTVRRPPGFYAHMIALETAPVADLSAEILGLVARHEEVKARVSGTDSNLPVAWSNHTQAIGIKASAELSQVPYAFDDKLKPREVFPEGRYDADLQQVDLRDTNSWRLSLADVPAAEMLEVQLVNSVAPFILCSKLAPLMRRDNTGQKHIVNVTAMEGKFTRYTKTDKHPHTNMAKAALNMLTHTSARDLAKDGIFMNAVDTGWVTDEDPAALSLRKQNVHDFQPPLDIVDGAARICDPFFHGILSGDHWCGKFLKDYFPTEW